MIKYLILSLIVLFGADIAASEELPDVQAVTDDMAEFHQTLNTCISTGKLRPQCIEEMPERLIRQLEQREAEQGRLRRGQMRMRQNNGQLFGVEAGQEDKVSDDPQ